MYELVQPEVRAVGLWRSYIALIRFHYHSSFIGVLLGALIITRDWSAPLIGRILLLYVSLTVLLYGGLYSLCCRLGRQPSLRGSKRRRVEIS